MLAVIHGDDFGLTSGINAGVIRAYHDGVLTSASLTACGQAADEAIELAYAHPGLDIGIHLVYTDETPLRISTDTFPSRQKLLLDLLTGQTTVRQIEKEWRTQIEKILSAGIRPSHIDSHQHVHLYPALFPLAVQLALEYDISFIRSTILEPFLRGSNAKRLLDYLMLKCWTAIYTSAKQIRPLRSIPTIGFLHAGGRLDPHNLIDMLSILDDKHYPVVEVMLHPGIGDTQTLERYRHWNYQWNNDLNLTVDPWLMQQLKQYGIQTVSFAQLSSSFRL
jgi:predicted glycoside hydrolase/deacetylase ChbG (UPF0249 family)